MDDHIATPLSMFVFNHCGARVASVLAACAALAACSSIDGASARIANVVTPYRIEVVQGNFVSREQVQALQPGMSRQQVKEILGTPLLSSLFHADRWDYVFTLKRQNVEPQERKLAVFFKGDVLDHFEGDEMPTEAEFVATLDGKLKKKGPPPVLEASEAALQRYDPPGGKVVKQDGDAAPDAPAPSPTSYPPLESISR